VAVDVRWLGVDVASSCSLWVGQVAGDVDGIGGVPVGV
jgi:hypothetical protein